MQSSLNDLIDGIPAAIRPDKDVGNIKAAQSALEDFDKKIKELDEPKELQKAAEAYDTNYPLFEDQVLAADSAEAQRQRHRQTQAAISMFQVACEKSAGGFSGISGENQGLQRKYESVCKTAVSSITALVGRDRFPSLTTLLSPHFYMLASKPSWNTLTKEESIALFVNTGQR